MTAYLFYAILGHIMQKNIKLGIIGLGNMGLSLLDSFPQKDRQKINVYDIDKNKLKSTKGCIKSKNFAELFSSSNVLILAIKPQDIPNFIAINNSYLSQHKPLLISIAAGIKTSFFEKLIEGIRIVRVMPNLAIKVRKSLSFISGGSFIAKNDLQTTQEIFSLSGKVIVTNEKQLDKATSITGSGPGYLFFFMEILYKNAIRLGFSKDTAKLMVLQTFQGATSIAKLNKDFETLMKQVASKNGTTEAAFKVFKQKNISKIITEGVKAANQRSQGILLELFTQKSCSEKKRKKGI